MIFFQDCAFCLWISLTRRSTFSSGSGFWSWSGGPVSSSASESSPSCQGMTWVRYSIERCSSFLTSRTSRVLVFRGRAKSSNIEDIKYIMERLYFGDWFILMQLCKNIHPEIFEKIVTDLRDRYVLCLWIVISSTYSFLQGLKFWIILILKFTLTIPSEWVPNTSTILGIWGMPTPTQHFH